MQVGFHLGNLVRFARIGPSRGDLSAVSSNSPVPAADPVGFDRGRRYADSLAAALDGLDELLVRAPTRSRSGVTSVVSSTLGLNMTQTATRLESVEEINTAGTSYTPFGPEFTGSGNSTALPTLSGVYDGSNGDDTLQFRVTRAGVHGESRIDVKVYDSGGRRLDTIRINRNHPLDREYTLSNGLIFTLGEGALVRNDEFFLDVYANTPSAVDPDKAFDGLRDERPNFDHGLTVTAGSFDVNGETINVNADDTINTVIDRINAAGAGVDAVFDAVSETVRLVQRSAGSAFAIALANDSSGFLAATKLSAQATPGLDPESAVPLQQTQRFSGVASGSILINGFNFEIDVDQDSLESIVQRINDADIGISASLVQGNQRFVLKAADEGIPIRVDDQGTQFFDALEIAERSYRAVAGSGLSRARTYRIADSVTATAELINDIFDPAGSRSGGAALDRLRDGIVSALRSGAPDGDSGIGLRYRLDSAVSHRFVAVDRQQLTGSIRNDVGFSRGYLGGLIAGLRGALAAYGASDGNSPSGTMLNAIA